MTDMERKNGVLLMAYGSPERAEDIDPYYTHIRGGRRPSPEEIENLRERYLAIGGKSPLLAITTSTATKLQAKLGSEFTVYVGMKHWHPYVEEVFQQISNDGITDLLAIALAPHYSRMSIGSYQEAVKSTNSASGANVKVKFVDEWYDNPKFLSMWKNRLEMSLDKKFPNHPWEDLFVLFTAHSLPEKILTWGDPYKLQLFETSDRLAMMLSLKKSQYAFSFQSAGHTSEPWLGPDLLDMLRELRGAGCKEILIAPIGFVSDHLEILYDIDVEAKEIAKKVGIHLERTESLNDSDEFVEVLSSIVSLHEEKIS